MRPINLASKRKYLLFWFFICTAFVGQAQFAIKYPVPAQGITVCLDSTLLTIHVDVGAATTSNDTVIVDFPQGISYIPGSVLKTGGTSALGIEDAGGTPESPKFVITPAELTVGQNITFTLKRKALCSARAYALGGGIFKDALTVKGSAGKTRDIDATVNLYNVNFPSLSFTQPEIVNNTVPGGIYTRTFTITNGADGCTDAVYFYTVYPSKSIELQSLKLDGNAITPKSVKGDTLFYSIKGALLTPDGLLCNGENLVFTETFKVKQCNSAFTTYLSGWGLSSDDWCQTSGGQGTVSPATGVPAYTGITRENIGFVDKCTPFDYTLTLTNGGTGNVKAATMYDIAIQQGQNGQDAFLDPMDTSLFTISNVRVGNIAVPFNISEGIMFINLKNLFTSDPDGAGGLADMDGDGYYDDLPSGQSIQIRVSLKFNCSVTCNTEKAHYGFSATLKYHTICDTIPITTDRLNSNLPLLDADEITEEQFLGKAYVPSNIKDNVPFRLKLDAGYYVNTSYYDGVNTRYRWKVVMPSGVTVSGSGNPTYGSTPVAFTQVGDTIIFTSSSNLFNTFSINLVYNCDTGGGTKIFNYTLEKIQDINTNCKCQGDLVCATVSTLAFCPVNCATGTTTYIPVVRRTDGSLGWTDANLSTRQNAAVISSYDLSKALYLDTLQITGSARQNNSASNLHLELVLDKTTGEPSGLNKLIPLSATVNILRGGVLVSAGTLNVASQTNSTSTQQYIDWDITSLLPAGGLMAGDSIYSLSKYQVSTNSGLPLNDVQSGDRWAFYNLKNSGEKDECNFVIPEMYLVGTFMENRTNPFNANGCNSFTLGDQPYYGDQTYYLARRFNTSGVMYENEYRPVIYIDSVVLDMPLGYDFISASFKTGQSPDIISMTPSSIKGQVYTFLNPGTWKNLPITVANDYGEFVTIKVRPNCSTQPVENINVKTYIRDFYYAYAGRPALSGMSVILEGPTGKTDQIFNTVISKPDILISDQTGLIQAAAPTESWVVRLSSISTSTVPYTWLGIPTKPGVNVVELKDVLSNTVLAPIPYPGGNWYKLSDSGISSGTSKDYNISFKYKSSVKDSLKVLAGWNCGGFPANPNSSPCGADSLWLKFTPIISEIEIIPKSLPVFPIDLCVPASFSYAVNCSQAGNTINNTFSIKVPAGLFPVAGSFEAEYPLGANNWAVLTPSISGGIYTYNLTEHPAYPTATGLPGILNAANVNQRQIGVRFKTSTDCDFVANTNFFLKTTADLPSGQSAIGSLISKTGPIIAISGVNPTYTTVNSISSSDLISCNNTATINVQSIIVGGTTGTTGTLKIELPIGLELVPNSLSCSSAFCPTFITSIQQSNGKLLLVYSIPSGFPAGSIMQFSIGVKDNSLASCGINTIDLRTEDVVAGLTCTTAPGGVCNSLSAVTGTANATLTIDRPALVFTSLAGNVTSISQGNPETYNVDFTVNNTGSVGLIASNALTIDFYCADGAGNPIGSVLSTNTNAIAIPVGSAFSASYTFKAIGCSSAGDLVAVVSASKNCICSPLVQKFHANVIPIANADNATTPEDTPVTFNIIDNDIDLDGAINPGTIDLDPLTAGQQTSLTIDGQGTFTVNTTTGDVTFKPFANFVGPVNPVTYQVCDDGVKPMCAQAAITVLVTPVNDAPVAVADNFETKENHKLEGNVLNNDYDVDGDVITVNINPIQPPIHGKLVLSSNGDFTYQPATDFRGTDSFIYSICDNGTPSLCSTALVTIVITKDVDCIINVPNSFSPNGDGIHDIFKIKCLYNYENPVIEIFNRWGNLVFKKDHYGDVDYWGSEADAWWTGRSDNKWTVGNGLLPVGTYYYVLKLNNANVLTGFLFLNK